LTYQRSWSPLMGKKLVKVEQRLHLNMACLSSLTQ